MLQQGAIGNQITVCHKCWCWLWFKLKGGSGIYDICRFEGGRKWLTNDHCQWNGKRQIIWWIELNKNILCASVCIYILIQSSFSICLFSKCTYLNCELFCKVHSLAGFFLIILDDYYNKTQQGGCNLHSGWVWKLGFEGKGQISRF